MSAEDANAVFRLGQYEYSYIYRDAPLSLEYARTRYGLFLHELAARLRQHVHAEAGAEAEVRYRHNVAHDGSMAPLLGALQVEEMVWPGMGSEVVFELYSGVGAGSGSGSGRRWVVRVLWGGRVLRSSVLGEIDMMPVEEFLGYLTGLVGEGASYVLEKCGY